MLSITAWINSSTAQILPRPLPTSKRLEIISESTVLYNEIVALSRAHPDFGRSVNPISTRGTGYAYLITTDTPGFPDLMTALQILM